MLENARLFAADSDPENSNRELDCIPPNNSNVRYDSCRVRARDITPTGRDGCRFAERKFSAA
jgi:hypothetical protein